MEINKTVITWGIVGVIGLFALVNLSSYLFEEQETVAQQKVIGELQSQKQQLTNQKRDIEKQLKTLRAQVAEQERKLKRDAKQILDEELKALREKSQIAEQQQAYDNRLLNHNARLQKEMTESHQKMLQSMEAVYPLAYRQKKNTFFEKYHRASPDYFSVNQDEIEKLIDRFERTYKARNVTFLMVLASLDAQPEALQYALNQGDPINARDSNGMSALSYALLANSMTPINFLLEQGADIQVKNVKTGYSLLHLAAQYSCKPEIIKKLVDLGLPINGKAKQNRTPLIAAASYNPCINIIPTLLELGADKTLLDDKKKSAFHYYAENNGNTGRGSQTRSAYVGGMQFTRRYAHELYVDEVRGMLK